MIFFFYLKKLIVLTNVWHKKIQLRINMGVTKANDWRHHNSSPMLVPDAWDVTWRQLASKSNGGSNRPKTIGLNDQNFLFTNENPTMLPSLGCSQILYQGFSNSDILPRSVWNLSILSRFGWNSSILRDIFYYSTYFFGQP